MTMTSDDIITTLNKLIATCEDGEEGFRACSEKEANPSRKVLFMDRALQCAAAKTELQGLVRREGGFPAQDGTMGAALHRRWLDVRAAISGKDDYALLDECERGEDIALQHYRNALEKELPPEVRRVVERQCQGAFMNHEMVKQLRSQARTDV